MNGNASHDEWASICGLDEIVPDTGVCALVGVEQVAVFRLRCGELHAIGNVDPRTGAAVLARGLVGNLGERVVVASPIHKQHFDLRTGECLESPQYRVPPWQVRCVDAVVQVRRGSP